MKFIPIAILVLFCACGSLHAQKVDTVDALPYFVIINDPTVLWVYKIGDASFLDLFSREKEVINGREYSVRIRKFSTNAYDTAYYRLAEIGYIRAFRFPGPKGFRESLILPRRVYAGQKWFESDSGWSYEVTGIDDSLTTPTATYRNLITVIATPVKTPDSTAQASRLYFAKGIGVIASTVHGAFQVYLTEMRKVTGVRKTDK